MGNWMKGCAGPKMGPVLRKPLAVEPDELMPQKPTVKNSSAVRAAVMAKLRGGK